jgi:hypothetical protein
MSRRKGPVELSEYAAMTRRMIRAQGRRFEAEGDEPELQDLFALHAEVDQAMRVAIGNMRDRGADISWRRIGLAVGMTGEGARLRWGVENRERV